MRCLVLGVRPYDFKDDDGARISGATVHYLTFLPEGNGTVGYLPMNLPASSEVADKIKGAGAPAFYDIEFGQRAGRGGRPQTTLSGVELVGAVSFAAADEPSGE